MKLERSFRIILCQPPGREQMSEPRTILHRVGCLAQIRPEEKAFHRPLTGFPWQLRLSCVWLQLEEASLLMKASYPLSLTAPSHCLSKKKNHGDTWVTAMGNYEGGRLWIESPVGLYPPPHATEPWHHNLRGDYHDLHNTWVKFSPRRDHAVEEVASGRRVSLALFSPRSWTRISPHALSELQDAGFYPPRTVQHVFCLVKNRL